MNKFMKEAIKEAEFGIKNGHGGPFGAVVVVNGKIVGRGHNMVVEKNDPTFHGEIAAIRQACENCRTFDLSGADLYTTGEPCPMCLGAILWANINKIYFGCTIQENAMIGFRDETFYNHLSISTQKMKDKMIQIDHEECLKLFEKFKNMPDKKIY